MKTLLLLQALIGIALIAQGISEDCHLGSSLDPTSPSSTQVGHFLDRDQPAPCSGTLTTWQFCFYTENLTPGVNISLILRVWRPQGDRYDQVANVPVSFATTPALLDPALQCGIINLTPSNQIEVQQGDVYAVYLRSAPTANVPVIAELPPNLGRQLYRDTRGTIGMLFTALDAADLEPVSNVGLHIYANISTSALVAAGTTHPEQEVETTATPASAELPSTSQQTTGPIPATTEQDSDAIAEDGTTSPGSMLSGGGVAAVVIFILLAVGASIAVTVIVLVCIKRRRKSPLLNCFEGNGTIVGLDNALYRMGSQHIAPLFSKSPSHRNRSDTYEYPNPNISISIKPFSSSVSETSTVTSTSVKLKKEVLKSSNKSSETAERIFDDAVYSTSCSITESHDYDVPSSLPAEEQRYINHVIETQAAVESPKEGGDVKVGEVAAKEDKSECPDVSSKVPSSVRESAASSGTDEEESLYLEDIQARLTYDFVRYRALLQKATVDEGEEESPYKVPPSREDEIYVFISQQKIKVIPRHSVTVTEVIGSGHFGEVEKGLWKSAKQNTTLEVALKTIPKESNADHRIKLLQEAVIMGQFSHPNVVQLFGIISRGDPLVLVMEYTANRDLKKYLLQLKPKQGEAIGENVPNLLLEFSEQVALGMHYLASKRLVHRDLAARNILVSKDNVCKIGDFGMARDISDNGFYIGNDGKVPLKWTAPEAISLKKYSTASDVWSYGCLLYEIWSLGRKPFKGLKNDEAIVKINSGFRLPPPPGCPQAIYALMIQCWHPVSTARPKYQAILTSLLEDPKKVLHIPQCHASSHALACILGGPLEAGLAMYQDIQGTYAADDKDGLLRDPDYEYMDNDSD